MIEILLVINPLTNLSSCASLLLWDLVVAVQKIWFIVFTTDILLHSLIIATVSVNEVLIWSKVEHDKKCHSQHTISYFKNLSVKRERGKSKKSCTWTNLFSRKIWDFHSWIICTFFTSQNDKLPHPFNIFNIFQFYHPIKWIIKN